MARPTFIKSLGLWDVILMNVVAVVGLRWIARGARIGPSSVTLWLLAAASFFVPLALAIIHLSRRYPDQGGLYAWTRRAFGPTHGFVCGWCLWVNNLFYFPSLLLFAGSNAPLMFGDRFAALAVDRTFLVLFVLGVLWLLIWLNVVGLQAAKRLQNIGALSTWAPAAMLLAFGLVALATTGSATSFTTATMVPRGDAWSNIGLWSAMCFAFSGFEISAYVGQEVRDPERTLPRGVLIGGAMVAAIYILGSAAVLVAVPASAVAELSGITDAVDLASSRVGLVGLGGLTAALLTIGAVAGTSSWVAGAARVPFAAGVDSVLPSAFARLHPRYRTPHVSLIIQGAVSSLIFVSSLFLSLGGAQTSVQEAYDVMVNVTILIYFIPYLYLFAALIRLRRMEEAEGAQAAPASSIPGGAAGLWIVAGVGFLATAASLGLTFQPPAGTTSVMNFEVNLIAQATIILGVGWVMYRRAAKRTLTC